VNARPTTKTNKSAISSTGTTTKCQAAAKQTRFCSNIENNISLIKKSFPFLFVFFLFLLLFFHCCLPVLFLSSVGQKKKYFVSLFHICTPMHNIFGRVFSFGKKINEIQPVMFESWLLRQWGLLFS